MTEVAVVILNYNGEDYLKQFLPSVIKHSAGYAIIVADNCSTDNSIDFLKKEYPSIQIIEIPENRGYSAGYNYALEQIEAKYYILLNSDIEVTENWITPVIKRFEEDSDIVAAQPKIRSYHNKAQFEYAGAAGGFIDALGYPFCQGRIFDTVETDHGQYDTEKDIFWATGACLFTRSATFHELGGFDEGFFAHMEEIDLCWRIQNSGKRIIYTPASMVFHVGGGTLNKTNPRKTYLNFRNGLSILVKNYSTTDLIFKLPFRIVLDFVAAAQMLFKSPTHSLAIVRAHAHSFLLLPSNLKKRRRNKIKKSVSSIKTVLLKSIVWMYFLKGKKQMRELGI